MTSIRLSSEVIDLTAAVSVVSHVSPLALLVNRPAVTIGPDATIADAAAAMESAGVTALLVEPLGGIITERDIVRAMGHGSRARRSSKPWQPGIHSSFRARCRSSRRVG